MQYFQSLVCCLGSERNKDKFKDLDKISTTEFDNLNFKQSKDSKRVRKKTYQEDDILSKKSTTSSNTNTSRRKRTIQDMHESQDEILSTKKVRKQKKIIKPQKVRKVWTSEEDATLLQLIKIYQFNWQLISQKLHDRTGKQIRDRYINILDPNINHESWKKEEDQILVEYYHKVGPYWSEISKYLKGRPENMVKNRFYSYIQKKLKKGEFASFVDVKSSPQNDDQSEIIQNLSESEAEEEEYGLAELNQNHDNYQQQKQPIQMQIKYENLEIEQQPQILDQQITEMKIEETINYDFTQKDEMIQLMMIEQDQYINNMDFELIEQDLPNNDLMFFSGNMSGSGQDKNYDGLYLNNCNNNQQSIRLENQYQIQQQGYIDYFKSQSNDISLENNLQFTN